MFYLYLLLGLAFLVVGGDFLVRGSVSLALKFHVSILVVGLTVVAFATSAPELIVSLEAALNGHPDIALGNVVGSNIANIGLIMGFTAMLFGLPVQRSVYTFDWIVVLLSTIALIIILLAFGQIGFLAGAVFTTFLIAYNYYKIHSSRSQNLKIAEAEIDAVTKKEPIFKVLIFLLLGVLGLRYGALFFVEGASGIALQYGVSERVISVTIVAFGTSVPELAASVIAALKNEKDLAIGNLLGSNIFNILAVLGISSLITPINLVDENLLKVDVWWMLGYAILVFPMMGLFTKGKLGRVEGTLLFLGYVVYIALTFISIK